MVILDTDLLSLLIRSNDRQTDRLRRRIDQDARGQVATTIISYEEQMRGWLAFTSRARTVGEQINAYARLSEHAEFTG